MVMHKKIPNQNYSELNQDQLDFALEPAKGAGTTRIILFFAGRVWLLSEW